MKGCEAEMTDREKVIKELEDSLANQKCGYMDRVCELYVVSGEEYIVSCEDLQNAIDRLKEQQKLVDDTPHWVFGNSYGNAWMKCSNCCVSQSGQTSCWSYCPNCGAKMEGQVEWDG